MQMQHLVPDACKKIVIGFAGLAVRFVFPSPVRLSAELVPFLCEDRARPDAEYEIRLLKQPLQLTGDPIAAYRGMKVYQNGESWLRVFAPLTAADGCQTACALHKNGKNILYYPASGWNYYAAELHLLHLIGIEELLLAKDALLLHSAVVELQGQTVLFSGSSGIGKSTQAALWEKYLGADVLNGDRCIIRKIENVFYGCGSPWCGTSAIYRKEQAPVKGIFILRQSRENTVRRIKAEAFTQIFQQCIVNSWDDRFITKLSSLIAELLMDIPVYELACRADEEAVRLAYGSLFGGDD